MANSDAGVPAIGLLICSACCQVQQSPQGMKSLRCAHPVCQPCTLRNPVVCTMCTLGSLSRPESFAEVNLEMSTTGQRRACQEKTSSSCCSFNGLATKCPHCSLYLCPEHVTLHQQLVRKTAEKDLLKLQDIRKQVEKQHESSRESVAAEEQFRLFKELAESKLREIARAVEALTAEVTESISNYEARARKRSQDKDRELDTINSILTPLQQALVGGNTEEILNAQRTFQYMHSSGALLPRASENTPPTFACQLDAVKLEGQINAAISAVQEFRDISKNSSPYQALQNASSEPSESAAYTVATRVTSKQLEENRKSLLYLPLTPSTTIEGAKIVTFGRPLDVDYYSAPNELLVLFVAEAYTNREDSKTTLRSYTCTNTELQTLCKEVPMSFVRNQQLITSFQPRRLAVIANKKLIAMTDVNSSQYSRHIFLCNFTGLAGHKVLRVEGANTLNGIHADGDRIFVCDTTDLSVYIVDYNESQGRQRRVACTEFVPYSISTHGNYMFVESGYNITVFSIETMQQVNGIPAVRLLMGTRDDSVVGADSQFRDMVHFSDGGFAINTATSLGIYKSDMTLARKIGGSGLDIPGIAFTDLMGMCAVRSDDGTKARIFACDRAQQNVIVVSFDL